MTWVALTDARTLSHAGVDTMNDHNHGHNHGHDFSHDDERRASSPRVAMLAEKATSAGQRAVRIAKDRKWLSLLGALVRWS